MRTVRPPLPAESSIVADLVLQSDCGMLPALFGDAAKALIGHLQAMPSNPYSAENTLVILDEARSPSVVGALIGSLARALRRTNIRTAALLFGWYGPGVVARFPKLARAGKALDALEPDDYYLSHIAVLAEHRGLGIGKELLDAGEEHARQQGAERLVLDVEEHNKGACSFYTRLGYRPASVISIDPGGRGAFSFLRMVKSLQQAART
jgi:ribosomal protein S18 acetylase RimI-like enzyme